MESFIGGLPQSVGGTFFGVAFDKRSFSFAGLFLSIGAMFLY
jgi:hypothetical protein